MRSLMVTDNTVERIQILDCGDGFAITKENKDDPVGSRVIILNRQEGNKIARFIMERK